MKRKKARQLTEHLDEKYILLAADPAAIFKKHHRGVLMTRILLVAACVTLLALGAVAAILPAMRPDPGVSTEALTDTGSTAPDEVWVEDPTIVKVQRLSTYSLKNDNIFIEDDSLASTGVEHDSIGTRLILLEFHIREGEQITVQPSQSAALAMAQRQEMGSGLSWVMWNESRGEYVTAREFLTVHRDGQMVDSEVGLLGKPITLKESGTLLWRYISNGTPCVADQFVDFTVTDSDGRITGGGSIYVGGLDLIPLTDNKTYYTHMDVKLNSIYRAQLLGAYRCEAEDAVEETELNGLLDELHQKAPATREALFADLSDDNFKLSMRWLLHEQSEAFVYHSSDGGTGMGWFTTCPHHDDRYALVSNRDGSQAFFLYNGIYQRVESREPLESAVDGTMMVGYYYLTDGTVVYFDIYNKVEMFRIVSYVESGV